MIIKNKSFAKNMQFQKYTVSLNNMQFEIYKNYGSKKMWSKNILFPLKKIAVRINRVPKEIYHSNKLHMIPNIFSFRKI